MSKNQLKQKILRRLLLVWQHIVFLFHDIPRYRQRAKYFVAALFANFSYLFAQSDFVLRIGRLSKRHKRQSQSYFPPPGYGIPPGKKMEESNTNEGEDANEGEDTNEDSSTSDTSAEYSNYSLFLWPGQLGWKLWLYIFCVFPIALLPLLNHTIEFSLPHIYQDIPLFISQFFAPKIWLIIPVTIFVFIFLPEVFKFAKELPKTILEFIRYLHFIIRENIIRWLKMLAVIALGMIIIFFPLYTLFNLGSIPDYISSGLWVFLIAFTVVSSLAIFTFRILFLRIRPVLFKTWSKWPESQYDLFLSVPHKVDLSMQDKRKQADDKYWRPDRPTPASQQALHYAKDRHSLQEVILNLALFDFLFRKKSEIAEDRDKHSIYSSIKMDNWLYYFLSPVWISYGLLLLTLFCFQLLLTKNISQNPDWPMLFIYPNNFAWAVVIWFIISYVFIQRRIKHLEVL